MRKLTHKTTVIQFLGLFTLVLLLGLTTGCDDKSKQAGPRPTPQVGVKVLVQSDVASTVELAGRVASQATAEVRPQVNGIVLKRLFKEGGDVTAGQQLYQIDPAVYQAQYDTAMANVQKAQTAVDNAKKIMDRYAEIIKVKGVSQQEYDTAVSTYNQGMADLAGAQAAVKTAKINLEYTKVYSPVSGRAGISYVTEGALVTASQPTPLVYVQQMNPMYIDITQSSAEFLRLQRSLRDGTIAPAMGKDGGAADSLTVKLVLEDGQPYIKYENGKPLLDKDGKPEEYTATMLLYDATVDKSTGSITMRAVVDNRDRMLLPGMFVRATVTEGIIEGALLVPLEAVQRTPRGEPYAVIVNDKGMIEERIIQSNRIYQNRFWIVLPGVNGTMGLNPGEQLVTEGLNRVRAGMPVGTYEAGTKPAPAKPIPSAPKE